MIEKQGDSKSPPESLEASYWLNNWLQTKMLIKTELSTRLMSGLENQAEERELN